MQTFTSQLVEHLKNQPDKEILHFQIAGKDDIHLKYVDIFEGSKKYYKKLKSNGVKPGDVVILILEHSLDLIYAYFGCILNGSIPSIMPFLTEKLQPEKYHDDLIALTKITKPTAVITYSGFLEVYRGGTDENPFSKNIIISEEVKADNRTFLITEDDNWVGLNRQPQDIVLLQHSSGSTGLQKGVALSHEAIFNQIHSYKRAMFLNDKDVIVSWLPLYHDMGLIACFLMPLLTATPLVLMSPFDWVKAPHRLMKSISEYKGTLCWLPNFAYNFCAKKIRESDLKDIDLSNLRAVINCSEPMRNESHELFYNRFAPYGFKKQALATCYAMAENVFAVTQDGIQKPITTDIIDLEYFQLKKYAKPYNGNGISLTMVSAGPPIKNTQIKVIDDNGHQVEERFLGEIAIKSDCMLNGYYNRQEETEKSFIEGWFKTGDLGYIADGELYISGRKKDLIIVGGKNIYPQDIEILVSGVKGVHPGRTVAFGLFNDEKGTEDVVVIAETDDLDPELQKEITQEIKRVVTQSTAIALKTVFLVNDFWLIKTSSGKIARSANKEKFLKEKY